MMMIGRRQERGIALVVVLWVCLLVAAIAGAFVLDTRTSARVTRNFVDNAQARSLADGGVYLAVHEALQPTEARRWQRDGRLYHHAVRGGNLEISIEDEAGKINLNRAPAELLEGLFLSAGMQPDAARAMSETVAATRGGDEGTERQLHALGMHGDRIAGTVDAVKGHRYSRMRSRQRRAEFASAGVPGSRNSPFLAVDSLGQLPGLTTELFDRLRPALTVYGDSDGLNYATAGREALLAIPGIRSEDVDLFLAERPVAGVPLALERFLVQGEAGRYRRDKESNFATVKVLATTENGAIFARIALVELRRAAGEALIIREWREGDAAMLRRVPQAPPAVALSGGAT